MNIRSLNISNWCNENSQIPEDDDEVFVYNHEVGSINDENKLRIFFTTKRLMRITEKNQTHMCADATYKLIWQGYPVLIVGTTDRVKAFHPFGLAICMNETEEDFRFIFSSVKKASADICNINYEPTKLIADGSPAITNGFTSVFQHLSHRIMCWAHLIRNVDKHLNLISTHKARAEIRVDIERIQLSLNQEIFERAIELFNEKWASEQEFLKYFNEQWVERNNGWYEGYATGIPSTNNALESVNRSVKDEHSFGCRMAVGQFFELVKCHIVHNWSSDRNPDDINAKIYASEPVYTLKYQTAAYQWIQAKKIVQIKKLNSGIKLNYIPTSTNQVISKDIVDVFMRSRTILD